MTYLITEAGVRNGHVFKRLNSFTIGDQDLNGVLDTYYVPRSTWSRDYFVMSKAMVIEGWLIDVLVRWDKIS